MTEEWFKDFEKKTEEELVSTFIDLYREIEQLKKENQNFIFNYSSVKDLTLENENYKKEYETFKEQLEKENEQQKKELESYKALDSHYDEIEEDAKRIAEENEQLKDRIEQLSNDNHVLKTSFITQQEQIEKMKCFIHSEIDFCMYCPLTKECENEEGPCPYAYATEEEQKNLLMDFIHKWELAE